MLRTLIKIFGLSLLSFNIYAGTAIGNLEVTATVINSCTVSTTPVAFNEISDFTVNHDVQGSVIVVCTNTGSYDIALSVGGGSGATFAQRKMTGTPTTNVIIYSLYTTAARTTVWGDGSSGSVPKVTGSGSATYPVYGRVPPQTTPAAGIYADTVQVTLTF